jgi:hypothetical protein
VQCNARVRVYGHGDGAVVEVVVKLNSSPVNHAHSVLGFTFFSFPAPLAPEPSSDRSCLPAWSHLCFVVVVVVVVVVALV